MDKQSLIRGFLFLMLIFGLLAWKALYPDPRAKKEPPGVSVTLPPSAEK